MARNGAGVYSLPIGYLATPGEDILSSQHNQPLEDIAAALTGSLPRDGSAGMTGNLAMGSNRITGLAAPVGDNDAARKIDAVLAPASTTVAGAVELATDAETITGTDTARAVTPAGLTAKLTAAAYAPLASPALTGTPTAPTQTAGDNTTKVATTAFVTTAVAAGAANLTAFADGDAGQPRIAAIALADDGWVGKQSGLNGSVVATTGLGAAARLRIMYRQDQTTEGFQFALSSDGGSTWSSYVTLATGSRQFGELTVNLVDGSWSCLDYLIGTSGGSGGGSGAISGSNFNAIRLRATNNAGWWANVWIVAGKAL